MRAGGTRASAFLECAPKGFWTRITHVESGRGAGSAGIELGAPRACVRDMSRSAGVGRIVRISAALLVLLGTWGSQARAQELEGRVVEHRLANGMTLILMERRAAPVVSAVIRFKVGSVDEPEGKTGLAHLYEHLAFRGTRIVGTRDYEREVGIRARIDSLSSCRDRLVGSRGGGEAGALRDLDRVLELTRAQLDSLLIVEELDEIYNLNGAVRLSASTTADLTTFEVDLPANRLPLWAVLEADRMVHGVPRRFEVERRICAEENRSRIDNDPEASLYREYMAAAFAVHPYRRPVPGWGEDLASVDPDDARAFYGTYYSPGNAVAAVVGDFDAARVIALAETTFGRIPAREIPGRAIAPEPPQAEPRRAVLSRQAEPAVFMGFHKPPLGTAEDRVFEILIEILTRDNGSRLNRALFVEKRIAMGLASWIGPGDRYPNLFTIAARPIWPHTAEEVEAALWVELEALAREPVSAEELRRAKSRLEADFLRGLRDNRGMAEALTYHEIVLGDWRYLEDRLDLVESIGPDDIQQTAARYLVPGNSTVAVLEVSRVRTEN